MYSILLILLVLVAVIVMGALLWICLIIGISKVLGLIALWLIFLVALAVIRP